MRVIGGSAKRLQLKTLDGFETRPTTDRIKETLFNMISPHICDCEFLDLFSGSGGIGIEALSRGAAEAVFVENNPNAMACIRENLAFTKLQKRAYMMSEDVMTALRKLEGTRQFEYIFMDPPYGKLLEKQVLEYLAESDIVYDETVIIVEAAKEEDFSYLESFGFSVTKTKEYKTNKHVFIERERGEEVC